WGHDVRWLEDLSATDVFGDPNRLAYFNRFLNQEKDNLPPDAWKSLASLAARALAELGVKEVRSHADHFKEFVNLLPQQAWLTFQAQEGILEPPDGNRIFDALFQLGLSRLVLPEDLAP